MKEFSNLTLAQRLRALRFAAGQSQWDAADALKCSQGTISKLEAGHLKPTMDHLLALRENYEHSIDAILDGAVSFQRVATLFQNDKFTVAKMLKLFDEEDEDGA